MKLYQVMWFEAGVITCTQFWKGCPQQNLGGQKTCKIRRDFSQLSNL